MPALSSRDRSLHLQSIAIGDEDHRYISDHGIINGEKMTTLSILVTGGIGFIGSHLSKELLNLGHDVRILDNLEPQVHTGTTKAPNGAQFIKGDVRNPDIWGSALEDVEIIFHQAAAVGIGQSMYQVRKYVEVNSLGTAILLDYLANGEHGVSKLIVASSNTIYGEGAYRCENCGIIHPSLRSEENLKKNRWEPRCPECGCELSAIPTKEDKPLMPTSIYAITKRDEEEMSLQIGRAYGIPTVALRYFNVYGPGQSLSNPYTGVSAIFSSRIKAGKPPVIYEDGKQTRDFINVRDIVQANLLAMTEKSMDGGCFNVGTGMPTSILEMARTIARVHAVEIEPTITGQYRGGDIRHCYADVQKIASHGFKPKVALEEGMRELSEWAKNQRSLDRFEEAASELEHRGLLSGEK